MGNRMPRTGDLCAQQCVICDAEFTYRPNRSDGRVRVYCSRPCFYEGLRRFKGGKVVDGVPQPRRWTRMRACEKCGAACENRTHNQRWCLNCAPDRSAQSRLSKYNVSHPDWVAMVAKHGGVCWICREREPQVVDHDHATGITRGALCGRCNIQLHGAEKEGWLEAATSYLKEFGHASKAATVRLEGPVESDVRAT